MEKDQLNTLRAASGEIKQLRASNQLMGARLDMFDKMFLLFTSSPAGNSMGMAEDVAFQLDKIIAEAEKS